MGKKRVRIQLTYTADFDDDFDTSKLQDVGRLICFGIVSFLRKDPEQGVDILPDAKLDLTFTSPKRAKKESGPRQSDDGHDGYTG